MPSPLRCLADLPDQPPAWLWPDRIPRGALTLLVGDPGRGKSLLTLDLAARVTTGRPWPDGGAPADPGDVLLLSAEDSLARTVRTRLVGLGADLRRVHYLNAGLWRHATGPEPQPEVQGIVASTTFGYIPSQAYFALWRDAMNLKSSLESLPDCRLVVIDPIPAYLHDIDLDDPDEARVQLAPLATLADVTGAAILAVAHRDSSLRGPAHRRQLPLQALAAMARAIYLVDRLPNDSRRSVLATVKNNLAAAPPALEFEVTSSAAGAPTIAWSTASADLTVEELLASSAGRSHEPPKRVAEIDRAVAWLQGALAAGPVPSQELRRRALDAGFSDRCLERARVRLGIVATNDRKIGGRWLCALPQSSEPNHRDRQNTDMAASAASAVSAASAPTKELDQESSTQPHAA